MEEWITQFKALGDATRLRLLGALSRSELSVNELTEVLQESQPKISRHLKVLREAGLIRDRREGSWAYYRLEPGGERGSRLWSALAPQLEECEWFTLDQERVQEVLRLRRERALRFFDRAALCWEEMRRRFEDERMHWAALSALVPSGLRLLDAGCGAGTLLPLLSPRAAHVVAVDHSPEMLNLARENVRHWGLTNVELYESELEKLPLSSALMDGVFLSLVLHYVSDPEVIIEEMERLLRPGGVLVVLDLASHGDEQLREEEAHQWLGFAHPQLVEWVRRRSLVPFMYEEFPVREVEGPSHRMFVFAARKSPSTQGEAPQEGAAKRPLSP